MPGFCVFSQAFKADDLLTLKTPPQKLVNDYSNTLTAEQIQSLEAKLDAYDDSTSTQILVVLVTDLNGNDVSDFSFKLGRAWGVGGKQFNNGIVFLISVEERKLEIATGYGAEGALPDAVCGQILDNVVRPEFRSKDYYRGIDEGTDAIMQAMRGEYTAPDNYNSPKKHFPWGTILFVIIMIIVALARNSGGGGGLASTLFWGSMLNGGGRGGSSGWSGGGGGGGGFGGFGGGSFGGGGASGSW